VILKSIIVLQHFINSHPAFKMRRFQACDIKKRETDWRNYQFVFEKETVDF
jgi:hypothetical protein